ncbi:MAG: hypothetical protein EAZ78_15045 [Oscillatoriales cyanobacterium]|nr:MAG: hypothetical protein EA000_00240 [Oscillatoriales cyanobacterium]TAD99134.1 MAG: hypothetical protein EAZ96_23580 [Oscillatoriales cyanobacterium]TAE02662.1 MAG: hypothetical protein EAZ98_01210 [Oscillatoriales cyanobacterium]TAF02596.1 MAG: hypothetical protein EAZ78_15045 [Oscillatoriales cyanobacterium]TAF69742.1 MAG: hypothetical protein EAZ59_07465 [Oscillatoriales cyanobacterium]
MIEPQRTQRTQRKRSKEINNSDAEEFEIDRPQCYYQQDATKYTKIYSLSNSDSLVEQIAPNLKAKYT